MRLAGGHHAPPRLALCAPLAFEFLRVGAAFWFGRDRNVGLRLAGLVGHHEPVADRVAHGVEEARAAMDVPPALVDDPLGVRADEQEFFEILVGLAGEVWRTRDMRLAGVAEFELRPLFLAIGAVDQEHFIRLQRSRCVDRSPAGRRACAHLTSYGATRRISSSSDIEGPIQLAVVDRGKQRQTGLVETTTAAAASIEHEFADRFRRQLLEEEHYACSPYPHAGQPALVDRERPVALRVRLADDELGKGADAPRDACDGIAGEGKLHRRRRSLRAGVEHQCATAAAAASSISRPVRKRSSVNGALIGCGLSLAMVCAKTWPEPGVALKPPVPQPQLT